MTQNLFAQFDKAYDLEGLKADIEKASEPKGEFQKVPYGDYEIKVQKLELTTSKSNKPMIRGEFKIVSEDNNGKLIYMFQVVDEAFKIHIANEFLRSLNTNLDITFESYAEYFNLITNVFKETSKYEYGLEYTANKAGYDQFKITDVFEV